MKKILVSGSLAYDKIMDFPGKFSEYILPDKIHNLNISFGVDAIEENFGGTAGNISYNLSLLEMRPKIFSSAGNDFSRYKNWLDSRNIDTSGIVVSEIAPTAVAHIITDQADNQISAFYMGALKVPCRNITMENLIESALAIVAPGNKKDMLYFSKFFQNQKMPYIFDPGQQAVSFSPEELKECVEGTKVLIANDYEISSILKKTSLTKNDILKNCEAIVTTLGGEGSIIETKEKSYIIPPAKPDNISDPTGAGDAYRAGLIKGMVSGMPWEMCGRLGAVVAVYTVEKFGTQTHSFTLEDLKERYKKNFGDELIFK